MALTCSFCPFNAGSLLPLLAFSSVLLLSMTSPSSSQPGFISIDCGATSGFTGSQTNLTWVTDDGYIATGKIAEARDSNNSGTTLQTMRYFPERILKNCYELSPVQQGSGYIVRANFYYGNFDGQNSMPQFSLIVDATIMVDNVLDNSYYEMYVPAKSDILSVCLARDLSSDTGDPFISSLELRPLPDRTTYDTQALQKGYGLYSIHTADLGSNSSSSFRYPNDALDRFWRPYAAPGNNNIATSHAIVDKEYDNPPLIMMQTAITDPETPYSVTGLSTRGKYHVIMYFCEINPNVTGPGQRVFDVYINSIGQGNSPWLSNLDIYKISGGQFTGTGYHTVQPITFANESMIISVKSSSNSTHPPLISGIQVLLLTSEPLLNATSVASTMRSLRNYYGINGSYGDPCLPLKTSWAWIQCDTTAIVPIVTSISLSNLSLGRVIHSEIRNLPTLTKLSLDGNNLTGMIPNLNSLIELQVLNLGENKLTGIIPELQSLQKLQTLRLQNNKLSGAIPASLGTLPKLRELFLANNQLEGEVPSSLLDKVKAGTLNLVVTGNSRLTCNGVSCDTLTNAPTPPNSTVPPPTSGATSKVLCSLLITYFLLALLRKM